MTLLQPHCCFVRPECVFGRNLVVLALATRCWEVRRQLKFRTLVCGLWLYFAFCISFTLHFVYTIGTPPWTNSNIDFNFIHIFCLMNRRDMWQPDVLWSAKLSKRSNVFFQSVFSEVYFSADEQERCGQLMFYGVQNC